MPEWTWEWWQWMCALYSSKLQQYRNLTIRLFSVISRTLIGGSLNPLQTCIWCILQLQPTGQYTELNVKTVLFQIIQFSISTQFTCQNYCHDQNWWLSYWVSALQSVVAVSISSDGDHGIHCWWGLMRPNKVETAVRCFRMSYGSVRRIFWSW